MRFAFAGTPEFGAAVLEGLLRVDRVPESVVTQPARPAGRGRHVTPSPVATLARQAGLPLIEAPDINSAEVQAALTHSRVAVLVVAAFGQLFRAPILSSFECINVHPSLLPAYRGASPIVRALMAGEAETGVCVMHMTEGLDEGPVAARSTLSVGPWDDRGTLESALALLGAHATAHVLDALAGGFVRWDPQEGPHSYAAKIGPSDRAVDAGGSASEVHDHVRAMSPRPGAILRLGDVEVRLVRTWPHVGEETQTGLSVDGDPGVQAVEGGRLFLGCGRGRLEILALQPSGKRVMTAAEFLRGYGSRLQSAHSDL